VTPLEAAIATGLPCFPCSEQKSPTIPGPGGHKHATDNPAALRALWRRNPGPLVGVRTGEASGLSVLDIDGPKHPEADVWLAAHRAQLPATRIHRSRSGGLHFIFRHVPGVRNSQGGQRCLPKGVDTRGPGGYVIWWPAAGYPVVCDAPPAPWPDWLLQALLPRPTAPAAAEMGPARLDHHHLEGLLRRLIFTPEGQRNSVLYWAACRFGEAIRKGEIGALVAEALLVRAALRTGLPEAAARRTIASGFRTTANMRGS
jgi:hypothetical protein